MKCQVRAEHVQIYFDYVQVDLCFPTDRFMYYVWIDLCIMYI